MCVYQRNMCMCFDLFLLKANTDMMKGHLMRVEKGGLSKEMKDTLAQLAVLQYRIDTALQDGDTKQEILL